MLRGDETALGLGHGADGHLLHVTREPAEQKRMLRPELLLLAHV